MKVEEYKVSQPEAPKAFDLLASGVKVGEVITRADSIFVQGLSQRIFVQEMIEGVAGYAYSIDRRITWVLYDRDYDRFEFNTENLPANQLPQH